MGPLPREAKYVKVTNAALFFFFVIEDTIAVIITWEGCSGRF